MKYLPDYWKDVASAAAQIPNAGRLSGKRILVTGATGMVCSAVIDVIHYLNDSQNADIELIIAGRSRERTEARFQGVIKESEYSFAAFDATKYQKLDVKADYIIHGASNANPAVYSKEPVETLAGNVIGMQTILDAARECGCERVLYVSSSEVYGNRKDSNREAYKETDYGYVDILNPRACYPLGKRAAETLCASYAQEYGVDFVIVRPGHIYGPSITKSDNRASAAFTRDVIAGNNIVMKSAGAQLRSYCYTLDCASAILAVLINGESGNAYNISNKDSVVSIRDIAEAFAEAGNVKVVFENPSDVEKKSYNLMSNSALNAERLEALGWKAVFDLDRGVRATLKYGGD